MKMNKWVLLLVVPSFVFNFSSKKSEQTLIAFDLINLKKYTS